MSVPLELSFTIKTVGVSLQSLFGVVPLEKEDIARVSYTSPTFLVNSVSVARTTAPRYFGVLSKNDSRILTSLIVSGSRNS